MKESAARRRVDRKPLCRRGLEAALSTAVHTVRKVFHRLWGRSVDIGIDHSETLGRPRTFAAQTRSAATFEWKDLPLKD